MGRIVALFTVHHPDCDPRTRRMAADCPCGRAETVVVDTYFGVSRGSSMRERVANARRAAKSAARDLVQIRDLGRSA